MSQYTVVLVKSPPMGGLSDTHLTAIHLFMVAFTEASGDVYIGVEGEDTYKSILKEIVEETESVEEVIYYTLDAKTLEIQQDYIFKGGVWSYCL